VERKGFRISVAHLHLGVNSLATFLLSEFMFGCVGSGLCSHQPLLGNKN
jgi:hypothetical protein